MPGLYRVDVPDAAFAAGVDFVMIQLVAAGANNTLMRPLVGSGTPGFNIREQQSRCRLSRSRPPIIIDEVDGRGDVRATSYNFHRLIPNPNPPSTPGGLIVRSRFPTAGAAAANGMMILCEG